MVQTEAEIAANNALAAEVAVAVPVPGTFDYLTPEDLEDRAAVGMRVLVPFGRRIVTGYIMALKPLSEMPDNSLKLKEIIQFLDDAPLFGPSLIALFRFASRYYHYPLGLTAAEALPSGLKVMSLRTAGLTSDGINALAAGSGSSEELEIMRLMDRPKGLPLARLAKKNRAGLKLVRILEARGWAKVETRIDQDRVKPKMRRWAALRGDPPQARYGPREKELMDVLGESGPQPLDDLRSRFPSLSTLVRRLESKGALALEEREVFRDSLGRALNIRKDAPELNEEQARAAETLRQALETRKYAPFLLYGVTGSGKTEVYLAAARKALAQGRSVLFLVPEISMTPAVEGLLKYRLHRETAVLHSGLSEGERYDQWQKIRRGEAMVVLGARSAIFSPMENLGLIIVDEEHDGAYKQEDKLKYQGRDLALLRGSRCGAVVVLGSATPSLESFYAAQTGKYGLLTLRERIGEGGLPPVDVVDLRYDSGRSRGALTPVLKAALGEVLDKSGQALLFINRRGLAGLPICLSCGHVLKCLNCSVSLTLHQKPGEEDGRNLSCHYCGFETEPPRQCPECGSKLIRFLGLGTERLEEDLRKHFPQARVARLDADTARPKGELTRILEALRDRELDVLVGTQMITKGHDFPGITLVGVIDADLGLHLPDFRAGERTFQLLAQVGGRAGRGADQGRVIVQTYTPDHYTLLLARKHDYLSFYREEIEQRRILMYPPFSRLTMLRLEGNSEERTRDAAEEAGALGRRLTPRGSDLEILGPAPAPVAKIKGKFRFQILVRSSQVPMLHRFLNRWTSGLYDLVKGQGVSFTLDVDPYQMM